MNRLRKHCCYLVGPIEDVADGGKTWREEITPFLHSLNIGVFCPINKATDTPEDENFRTKCEQLKFEKRYDEYHDLIKQIVSADYRMVDLASFIIVYIDKNSHMSGSYHETAMAAIQRKPMIVCCKQGINAIPGWLWGIGKHAKFFDNWNDVKNYIQHIDQDKEINTYNRWRFFDFDKVYGYKFSHSHTCNNCKRQFDIAQKTDMCVMRFCPLCGERTLG